MNESKICCFVFKVVTKETPATTKRRVPPSSVATSSTNPTIPTAPSTAFKPTTTSLFSSKGTTQVTKDLCFSKRLFFNLLIEVSFSWFQLSAYDLIPFYEGPPTRGVFSRATRLPSTRATSAPDTKTPTTERKPVVSTRPAAKTSRLKRKHELYYVIQ